MGLQVTPSEAEWVAPCVLVELVLDLEAKVVE